MNFTETHALFNDKAGLTGGQNRIIKLKLISRVLIKQTKLKIPYTAIKVAVGGPGSNQS